MSGRELLSKASKEWVVIQGKGTAREMRIRSKVVGGWVVRPDGKRVYVTAPQK